jgi:hypothetical protein
MMWCVAKKGAAVPASQPFVALVDYLATQFAEGVPFLARDLLIKANDDPHLTRLFIALRGLAWSNPIAVGRILGSLREHQGTYGHWIVGARDRDKLLIWHVTTTPHL